MSVNIPKTTSQHIFFLHRILCKHRVKTYLNCANISNNRYENTILFKKFYKESKIKMFDN